MLGAVAFEARRRNFFTTNASQKTARCWHVTVLRSRACDQDIVPASNITLDDYLIALYWVRRNIFDCA
ncbi:MAG: hypothetical protein ACI9BW_001407 [Gammaproteobacteria bacterium]|jgi:hypothetical protein